MSYEETFTFRGVIYKRKNVRCGKKACHKCPHGPYWYAIIPTGYGKPAVRYVGKILTGPVADAYTNRHEETTS